MNLIFTPPTMHPPGTVFKLLKQAWDPLWNPKLENNIRQFDFEVTDQPMTIGACTFITTLDAEPVGMASYDPRQKPCGIIGWNCVAVNHQRNGIGKAQINEIIRIFHNMNINKVCVTTTDEAFFIPAQRTYEACGFIMSYKTKDNNLEYELTL